jgi:uncharacterized protein (TIGR03546 family)
MLTDGASDSNFPARFAAGVAVGVLLGFVPRDGFAAILVGLPMLLPPVSLRGVILSVILSIPIGAAFYSPANWLGQALLETSFLRPLWQMIARLPLVPWIEVDRPDVLGGLLLGLGLATVAHRTVLPAARRNHTRWIEQLIRWSAGHVSGYTHRAGKQVPS